MPRNQLNIDEIIEFLDICLDVEFSFIKSHEPAEYLVHLSRSDQDFILNLVKRVAATNVELAFQFACNSIRAMEAMDRHMVEAWAMTATDNYDQKGLFPAMSVIRELDNFVQTANVHACGAVLEEEVGVLLPFLHGLSGRKLKIAEAEHAYTDTETVFLPPIVAQLSESKENFLIYKASVAYLWAQIQFGTFRFDIEQHLNSEDALKKFCALETLRLNACIKRELPGLYRDIQILKEKISMLNADASATWKNKEQWLSLRDALSSKSASVNTTLELLDSIEPESCPEPYCYQGTMKIDEVRSVMGKRIEKEKAYFRVALSEIARDMMKEAPEKDKEENEAAKEELPEFKVRQNDDEPLQTSSSVIELEFEGDLVALPEHVRELMTSIMVDFGEIPPEHLYAAGPGEYDLKKYEDEELNPDDVWKGTYHEEGAELYNEWNFKRQHYHKNWCVLREIEVQPVYDDFVDDTINKHKGLLKSLRHTFEILRGEDKLLKKQPYGDDIDIDALVEALADAESGAEMTNRVFTKMHKEERNVAVIFMVDMSGSTKGWINDAERESLVLLAEVLEILGDRYAIYGFSGMTRKRCDLFKIKTFDEDYDETIKARISNMQPQDYTRMGVFIRHMTRMFSQVEASTKLLITISDGKPDDYDTYRGEYGVEDTRQALYEAHRDGIHSFCITIDEKARDYLPHMYGAANYAVIDDVAKLPLKVSDIYRRITS
jgi:nitric oxide reductase NorD protein